MLQLRNERDVIPKGSGVVWREKKECKVQASFHHSTRQHRAEN